MTRVLVVDDSPTQARALALTLESEGHIVEMAASGEQAMLLMEGRKFDLVITDILMPGISGYELCQRIKRMGPETRRIPVILLTTLKDPMDIIQGLASGADNFVTKPFDPKFLIERVHALLASRQLRRASGANSTGVDILFLGKSFTITAEKDQILDLLISTFEDMVRTNHELEASRSALTAANSELESFSYSVSHDLRAPLRTIEGFARILIEDHAAELGAMGCSLLTRIREATDRMRQLIEDLIDLARVGRSELHRQAGVDLSGMACACAEELERRDPARTIEWTFAEGIEVAADPRLLRIVVENLLGNAWKFTRSRNPAHIELSRSQMEGERVYIVRDDGAGFDMAHAANLFAPFQRLHSPREFEGTGIGLATVQRIIHRHGGRIWAEGTVGRGAAFFFTLGE